MSSMVRDPLFGHPRQVGRRLPHLPGDGALVGIADVLFVVAALGMLDPPSLVVVLTLLVLVGQGLAGAYGFRVSHAPLAGLPRLLAGVAVPTVALSPVAAVLGDVEAFLNGGVVLLVALVLSRAVSAWVIGLARHRGQLREVAVILGSGEVARQLASRLTHHRELGIRLVGYVDDGDGDAGMPVPRLGGTAALASVLEEHGARHVLTAFGHASEHHLVDLLRVVRELDVRVLVVPRFFELGAGPEGRSCEDIWGIPLHRLPTPGSRAKARHLKRAFDVVVASAALVVLAPLLIALALGVRLGSPGPVLFRQTRIGQHGREFELLKFRSMRVNGDADTTWDVSSDARVTRFGRLLRDRSLDELPQLWNVVRGDMSLVGPRPERPHFAAGFTQSVQHYADRHRVPAGMTGWAQVHGLRGDTSIVARAQFDNNYIETWSLWSDLTILARTALVVLRPPRVTEDVQ